VCERERECIVCCSSVACACVLGTLMIVMQVKSQSFVSSVVSLHRAVLIAAGACGLCMIDRLAANDVMFPYHT